MLERIPRRTVGGNRPADGTATQGNEGQTVNLVISGDPIHLRRGDHAASRGRIWFDSFRSPQVITSIPWSGSGEDKRRLGIYEVEANLLTLCLAEPGAERPHEFVAVPERQQLLVCEREGR